MVDTQYEYDNSDEEPEPKIDAAGEVKEILESFPDDIDEKQKDGLALVLAAMQDNFHLVDAILDQGKVDINAQDPKGMTALIRACGAGAIERRKIIEQLIEKGANVNIEGWDGKTALDAAARHGPVELLDLLLYHRNNSQPAQMDKIKIALVTAAKYGNRQTFQRLLKCKDVVCDGVDREGRTALHYWAGQGDTEMMRTQIRDAVYYGANVNHASTTCFSGDNIQDGETPLHIAARKHYRGIVATLIEKKADPTIRNKKRETALDVALQSAISGENSVRTCSILIDAGAVVPDELGTVDNNDPEALVLAALMGHHAIVKILLQMGIDPNGVDHLGRRPLVAAACGGSLDCVTQLLARGAEVDARGGSGESGGAGVTALAAAGVTLNKDIVLKLLEKGADASALDERGLTPLMQACKKAEAFPLVEILLPHVDVNQISPLSHKTALHFACASGQIPTIEKLLEHKADLEAKDRSSFQGSPLMSAVGAGQFDVCALLVERGAQRVEEAADLAAKIDDVRIAALLRGEQVPPLPEPMTQEEAEKAGQEQAQILADRLQAAEEAKISRP